MARTKGEPVTIAGGQYEIVSFKGGTWSHAPKHVYFCEPWPATLLQYVDHPDNAWNALVEVTDENGHSRHVTIMVKAASIEGGS